MRSFLPLINFAFNRYEQLASVCVFLLYERIESEPDETVRYQLKQRMDDLRALYASRCRMPLLDHKHLRDLWRPTFGDYSRMSS